MELPAWSIRYATRHFLTCSLLTPKNLHLPPAAGGAEKYAISYITPTGLGKMCDWGAINISPLRGFGKQQTPPCPPQPEAQKNTCPVGSPYRINGG